MELVHVKNQAFRVELIAHTCGVPELLIKEGLQVYNPCSEMNLGTHSGFPRGDPDAGVNCDIGKTLGRFKESLNSTLMSMIRSGHLLCWIEFLFRLRFIVSLRGLSSPLKTCTSSRERR